MSSGAAQPRLLRVTVLCIDEERSGASKDLDRVHSDHRGGRTTDADRQKAKNPSERWGLLQYAGFC